MKPTVLGLAVLALFLPFTATAMTAVCKEPKGRILGMIGGNAEQERVDAPDGMTGGVFTFTWDSGAKVGTVVSMGTSPSEPQTRRVHIVFESAEQVTFLDPMSSSVWMYSVYPNAKRMILTSHNSGAASLIRGAIAKLMDAECSIGD